MFYENYTIHFSIPKDFLAPAGELNLFHHIFQMIVLMSSIDDNKIVNQKNVHVKICQKTLNKMLKVLCYNFFDRYKNWNGW